MERGHDGTKSARAELRITRKVPPLTPEVSMGEKPWLALCVVASLWGDLTRLRSAEAVSTGSIGWAVVK